MVFDERSEGLDRDIRAEDEERQPDEPFRTAFDGFDVTIINARLLCRRAFFMSGKSRYCSPTSKRSRLAESIDLCARTCSSTFSGNGASR